MHLFRIAGTRHIRDLTGTGARINGGRWNPKGIGVLYTSPSRALATVEYLAHVPLSIIPHNLAMATIEVPDDILPNSVDPADLPDDWRTFPAPAELARIGGSWARSQASLLLRVPSAVVEEEFNILINPAHPDMRLVQLGEIKPYSFDERLLR